MFTLGLTVLPALIAAFFLVLGVGELADIRNTALETGIHNIGIASAVLVATFAIGRRTAAGYLLGLVVAGVVALGCLVVVVGAMTAEGMGSFNGLQWLLGVPAAIGLVIATAYGFAMERARSSFPAAFGPLDRRVVIALGVITLVTVALPLAIGLVWTQVLPEN